jgi:RHS repeat-associated protein
LIEKFTGQRLDQSGLYFYNARYYDANIGRFISPDTLVPNPANPQSLNRYSYCLNNPLRYNDPSGHEENSSEGYTVQQYLEIGAIFADIYGPECLIGGAQYAASCGNTTMFATCASLLATYAVSGGQVSAGMVQTIGMCLSGNISKQGYEDAMSIKGVNAAVATYWSISLAVAQRMDKDVASSMRETGDPWGRPVGRYNNPGTAQYEILVNNPGYDLYEGYGGLKGFGGFGRGLYEASLVTLDLFASSVSYEDFALAVTIAAPWFAASPWLAPCILFVYIGLELTSNYKESAID